VIPAITTITGGTPVGDALTLALAAVWVLLPGGLVLVAAGLRTVPVLLGAAPATSIGISTVAATTSGLAGSRFSWWLVLATTLGLAAVSVLVRGRAGSLEPDRVPRGPAIAAGALLLAATATACELFRRGMGSLATPTQEHDTLTHTLIAARILRTGDAAPWRAQVLDVVTGTPAQYYPNGLHQWAALTAQTSDVSVVAGLNATSVVVLALVQPLGLLALAARALPRTWLPAGGVAAIASVLAYQPLQAMHHDSGALPNAAALAFAPGVIALLLPPPDTSGRAVAALVPGMALALAGAVTVHPSAAVTVGGGFLGCYVLNSVVSWRNPLRWRWFAGLLGAGVLVAALVGTALAQAAAAGGGSSSRFVRDVSPQSLPDALHRVLTLPLQGGLDPAATREQWWLAVPVLLGVLLAGRRAGAVALTWLVWTALAVAYLVDLRAPGLDLLWDTAWNSYYRVVAHGSPWAWLLVGVAVVRLADLLARHRAPVAATVLGAVLLAGNVLDVFPVEVQALRARYADPAYQRIDADDEAAARYLAAHVAPGERVLNSGNDGSTYAYVLEAVPILATTAVPTAPVPDVRTLLARFRDLATDPEVRRLVAERDIGWVVVDSDAPGLPLRPADAAFFGVPDYSVPPGLIDLDGVQGLRRVFSSGTVGVWRVTVP
jgi:hypothetical protein